LSLIYGFLFTEDNFEFDYGRTFLNHSFLNVEIFLMSYTLLICLMVKISKYLSIFYVETFQTRVSFYLQ